MKAQTGLEIALWFLLVSLIFGALYFYVFGGFHV